MIKPAMNRKVIFIYLFVVIIGISFLLITIHNRFYKKFELSPNTNEEYKLSSGSGDSRVSAFEFDETLESLITVSTNSDFSVVPNTNTEFISVSMARSVKNIPVLEIKTRCGEVYKFYSLKDIPDDGIRSKCGPSEWIVKFHDSK